MQLSPSRCVVDITRPWASVTRCREVCPAASTGVAKVAAVSNTADRSFTLCMGILQWSGEARLASPGDVRLLRHRPKETSLHAHSTRREADEHRSVAWPGPESVRLV